ncbi:MAG: diguanylate cyclase [Woeseiaceae bacterium]|jgi:diguanylate cyclase (GGDEF)-like protein
MLNQATHLSLIPSLLPGVKAANTETTEFDREFRQFYVDRMLPVTRAALGLWLALIVVVSVLDRFLMPSTFAEQVLSFRVLAMMAPLSAALAASFILKRRLLLPYITAVAAFLAGATALLVNVKAVHIGAADAYWSVVFATFCIYLVLGLTLRQSICTAWPLFIGFLTMSSVFDLPIQESAYGTVFLCLLNFIGTFASYLLERNAREVFDNKHELLRLARTDGLTGLFSRRAFDQHLRQIWKQALRDEKRVAVMVADIDHFRLYNDCYGHRMGDGCIKAVAEVIAASANRPLDMVARYGGEEFVLVLYDPTASFLETFTSSLCEKVIDLDIEHKASETAPIVSLSIGAAITEAAGSVSSDQLIRQADDALYEAKNQGRNQAIVYRAEWGKQTTASLAAVLI